jgi:hypothetical protein
MWKLKQQIRRTAKAGRLVADAKMALNRYLQRAEAILGWRGELKSSAALRRRSH